MTAVSGIRAELAKVRAEADEATRELTRANAEYAKASAAQQRCQKRAFYIDDRIENLVKALRILGAEDEPDNTEGKDQ